MSIPKRLLPAGLALVMWGCAESAPPEMPPLPPSAASEAAPSNSPDAADKAAKSAKASVEPGKRAGSNMSKALLNEIIEEGQKALKSGDLRTATALLEEAQKHAPDNRELLFMLAEVNQYRAGELERPLSTKPYLRSAELIRKLRSTYPKLTDNEQLLLRVALYNEARTYAVEGRITQALASLNEAVDAGFVKPSLMRQDPELAGLRENPQFQELVKKLEGICRENARQTAANLLTRTKPFPFEFSLKDTEGKTLSSADLKGKLAILDIWGTWCPPCRQAIPHFIELDKKYRDKGLQIVGINYERVPDEQVVPTIAAFVKEHKITYPCVIGDEKTRERVPDFSGFPTTLVVDRKGQVRAMLTGFDPDDSPLVLEDLLTTLFAEDGGDGAEASKASQ